MYPVTWYSIQKMVQSDLLPDHRHETIPNHFTQLLDISMWLPSEHTCQPGSKLNLSNNSRLEDDNECTKTFHPEPNVFIVRTIQKHYENMLSKCLEQQQLD